MTHLSRTYHALIFRSLHYSIIYYVYNTEGKPHPTSPQGRRKGERRKEEVTPPDLPLKGGEGAGTEGGSNPTRKRFYDRPPDAQSGKALHPTREGERERGRERAGTGHRGRGKMNKKKNKKRTKT